MSKNYGVYNKLLYITDVVNHLFFFTQFNSEVLSVINST